MKKIFLNVREKEKMSIKIIIIHMIFIRNNGDQMEMEGNIQIANGNKT